MLTEARDTVDAGLWVPVAEAAKRQTPPVSRQAMHKRVTALVSAGRLSTRRGPRNTVLVNIVALNRVIAAETDPAQALRNGRVSDDLGDDEPELPEAADGAAAPASNGSASYHTSRANREAYQAENARLDLEERLRQLVYVDEVDRRTMAAARKIRDRLLSMPAMVADRVAAAPDARAVRALLMAEMRNILGLLESELMKMDEDDAGEFDDDAGDRQPEAAAA